MRIKLSLDFICVVTVSSTKTHSYQWKRQTESGTGKTGWPINSKLQPIKSMFNSAALLKDSLTEGPLADWSTLAALWTITVQQRLVLRRSCFRHDSHHSRVERTHCARTDLQRGEVALQSWLEALFVANADMCGAAILDFELGGSWNSCSSFRAEISEAGALFFHISIFFFNSEDEAHCELQSSNERRSSSSRSLYQ